MEKLVLSFVVFLVLLSVIVYADSDKVLKKSDGSMYDVKVLPHDAVRNAFGSEVENVEINIEERENNNIPKVIYKVNGEDYKGRFLGIFKIRTRYEAEIDAETVDVLEWKGPWWAFLITGEPAKPEIRGDDAQEDDSQEDEDDWNDSDLNEVSGDQGNSGSGTSGAPSRAFAVVGYIQRDVNAKECEQIGGEMKTDCFIEACRTYCDFSGISNKEEKCASLNGGEWLSSGDVGSCMIVEIITEKDRCESLSGKWMQGQTGELFCNEATEDAGESCWHSGQCDSVCFAPEGSLVGQTNVRGNCYEYKNSDYECRSQVMSGVVVTASCA